MVAYQIISIISLGSLNTKKGFASGHNWAHRHLQKMIDKCFDISEHFVLTRRSRERMIGFDGAIRHILYTLLNDAHTLPHFFYTHDASVVTITILCSRNIELKVFITA